MKVGIVGFGYVGQAVYHVLDESVEKVIYDIGYTQHSKIANLKDCEFIFICLPTPTLESGGQSAEAIKGFFSQIEKHIEVEKVTFIMKSTVLLENIKDIISKFTIVMNPEFLSQNSAFEDCEKQKTIILGGPIDSAKRVQHVYEKHSCIQADYLYVSHEEAIQFKYIRNIYGAYKVLFWNWVQQQTGNVRKFASMYDKIPQGEMSQIAPDGQLGFGGACFPKDLLAFHDQSPHLLTKFIQEYNKELRSPEDFVPQNMSRSV